MKNLNHSASRAGLIGAVLLSLTGCVVYEEPQATRTVYTSPPPYVPPPPPPYVPPPPPPVFAPPPPVEPAVVVIRTENDFYEPLTPYGEWVVVASFGRCWRPARVDAAWRPYASGYWQRTDAGWYWASDEPWGWATYHYGRWDWTRQYGWIWVPQTQWAPAWVSWRQGAGYVGWAPLPPAARITVGGTVEIGDAVIAARFVFVEERRMMEPVRPRSVIVNNTTVINKTVNITKIKVVNKTVINEGPHTDVIERASGRKVQALPVRDVRHKEETEFVARKRGDRPPDARGVSTATRAEPAPAAPGRPRELSEPTPVAKPNRPEPGTPARVERQPEVIPAARPAANAASKPVVATRETPPVAKPTVATQESPPAPTRHRAGEIAGRPTPQPSAPTATVSTKTAPQPNDRPLRSPKGKTHAPQAAMNNGHHEDKKGDAGADEKPATRPAR